MTHSVDSVLAIAGGPPVRSVPLPNWADASGRRIGGEEREAVLRVLESGTLWRVTGSETPALEGEFARRMGTRHAVASTSGTAALHLAVAALNPEPGDEIVVPPITDFGTVIAVLACGAVPVFADVDEATGCLTADSVEAVLTERTRAVIVVHLFGGPAPVEEIVTLCDGREIPVIEDCAQSYLTEPDGDGGLAGTRGRIGCFSLQQSKHMTAGDGGITITDDGALADRMRLFADKGWPRAAGERTHLMYGVNYRMTELTAAVARAQLVKLDDIIADRRRIAGKLIAGLAGLRGLRTVSAERAERHSFWLFPMWIDPAVAGFSMHEFARALQAEGIAVGPGYLERPVYLSPALTERRMFGTGGFPLTSPPARVEPRYRRGDCPIAESMIGKSLVAGPCNENYTDADVDDYLTAIHKVVTGLGAALR